MAADDRLSALPDDLLKRILHFLPSKESASTSVLSRRWGSLWRSSGAVNLAVRVPGYIEAAFFSCQEAFVRAAGAALAAEAPVTRLTLRVETDADADQRYVISRFLYRDTDYWSTHGNLADAVLSHPKAGHVEELRLALVANTSDAGDLSDREVDHQTDHGLYKLVSLPSSETLRVLDLTRCDLAAPAVFPRLATLRLRLCSFQLKNLQAMFDAAPELAAVHLESVFFTLPPCSQRDNTAAAEPAVLGLRFRAVTTLVLASCRREVARHHLGDSGGWGIEIDAPRLRSLVYKGLLRRLVLRSPAPDLALVDLHFHYMRPVYREEDNDKERTRTLFWQSLHNFTNARVLKLKMSCDDLGDIAAIGRARRAELLHTFPNAERVELEGPHCPVSKTAAVAIANLLHCCPVVRDLKLKLSTVPLDSVMDADDGWSFLERKDRVDYSKSIDRFTRRSSKTTIIAMEDSSGDDDVPDIPGLSGRSFACLQSSLRRVNLQFRLDDSISSRFGRQLIKFFGENAMGLEEMCVDSGNRRLYEHLNFNNVSTKACFEHTNLAEGSCDFSRIPSVSLDSTTGHGRSTGGFTLLPLRR